MFIIPRPNIIESSDGFSVEVLGRTGLIYTEGKCTVKIDSEVLAGPSGLVIYTDSITSWLCQDSVKKITQEERQRILFNVVSAFKFRGYDIEVN